MKNELIIDVREVEEFKKEHIPYSINAPLSNVKLNLVNIINNAKQDSIILMCKSGNRANMAYTALNLDEVNNKKISVYEGGILKWGSQGKDIISNNKKDGISINRQVQIVAGGLIILFSTLNLNYITLLMGFGLFGAGIFNNCLMAKIIMKMPWNK